MIKARRSKKAVKADFHPEVCDVIALLFSAKLINAIQLFNAKGFNIFYATIVLILHFFPVTSLDIFA